APGTPGVPCPRVIWLGLADQEKAELVDIGALSGVEQGRAVELLDQRGSVDRMTRRQMTAIVDGAFGEVADTLEEDAPLRAGDGGARRSGGSRQPRRIRPAPRDQASVDDLDRLVGRRRALGRLPP